MNDTLALAASIAAMDRDALLHLVAKRSVSSPGSVNDPLGLALELLRAESISRGLQSLHRDSLLALVRLSQQKISEEDRPELHDLAAVGLAGVEAQDGAFVGLPEVARALEVAGFEPAGSASSASSDSSDSVAAHGQTDTSAWFGAALTSVRRGAELIRQTARRPLGLGRKGQPTAIALRSLAERLHSDQATIDRLVETMRGAGLLTEAAPLDGHRELRPAAQAGAWLELDYPGRWVALALPVSKLINARLRRDLEHEGSNLSAIASQVTVNYPLLPEPQVEALRRLAITAEDLGLTVEGQFTGAALNLLSGDTNAALEGVRDAFPEPVEGVYVQPDLSLIVPGPLHPADEAAVSAIADTEQLGPAASMRLSPASLKRAARNGITPSDVRALLTRLSLTGIPQPLDYLLDDLARSGGAHGSPATAPVGVSADFGSGVGALADPFSDSVAGPGESRLSEDLLKMVERVFAAAKQPDGNADLTRKLELAIRHRSPVEVTAVASNDERRFTLLPLSLRGGRLRAVDEQAGVERTLPVSAITAVSPVASLPSGAPT